ncbi:MAG: VWA domain-containing protein [Deltaproteobacteria bacterium]|nr:VWA domain-containing protein [Deltaproteobacteria bacterium]
MRKTILLFGVAGALFALGLVARFGFARRSPAPSTRSLAAGATRPSASSPWERPASVVVVLDRATSEFRWRLAREAVRELVEALGPEDRLGVVAAGGDLLTQSGSFVLDPGGRARVVAWLESTTASAETAQLGLGPTLQMAEGLLKLTTEGTRSSHIVLVSDGAHIPGVLSHAELREMVTGLARSGVRVDAASPGVPELRPPLEALAELGGGRLVVLRAAAGIRELPSL